jgi:hypothetical protein
MRPPTHRQAIGIKTASTAIFNEAVELTPLAVMLRLLRIHLQCDTSVAPLWTATKKLPAARTALGAFGALLLNQ